MTNWSEFIPMKRTSSKNNKNVTVMYSLQCDFRAGLVHSCNHQKMVTVKNCLRRIHALVLCAGRNSRIRNKCKVARISFFRTNFLGLRQRQRTWVHLRPQMDMLRPQIERI